MSKQKLTRIIHCRRCHICGTFNQMENSYIDQCQKCGKYFAPFYFFDEGELQGIEDNGLVLTNIRKRPGYYPLIGFSTYWIDE